MYHYLSSRSKGLFRAALPQSGTPLSTFCQQDKHPAYYTRSFADELGCDGSLASQDLVKCMQKLPAYDIVNNFIKYAEDTRFKPIVDDFSSKPFLPIDPLQAFEKGSFNDVPLMIGNNKDEGIFGWMVYLQNETKIIDDIKNWHFKGPLVALAR
jgi:carboxylesterase type B